MSDNSIQGPLGDRAVNACVVKHRERLSPGILSALTQCLPWGTRKRPRREEQLC
ncbi:hypothetical protein AOLI_G00128510 [Acnodon oligacanthus]